MKAAYAVLSTEYTDDPYPRTIHVVEYFDLDGTRIDETGHYNHAYAYAAATEATKHD